MFCVQFSFPDLQYNYREYIENIINECDVIFRHPFKAEEFEEYKSINRIFDLTAGSGEKT